MHGQLKAILAPRTFQRRSGRDITDLDAGKLLWQQILLVAQNTDIDIVPRADRRAQIQVERHAAAEKPHAFISAKGAACSAEIAERAHPSIPCRASSSRSRGACAASLPSALFHGYRRDWGDGDAFSG